MIKFFSSSTLILLFVVLGCTEKQPKTANTLPDPLAAGWQGAAICEVLQETATIRMLRCTFPPGEGHERHYHAAHVGYTVAGGRMRITDSTGTREVDTKAGGSFSSDGIAWHEVLNVGDSTAIFLIIEPK
jgi:quercetin dioxygenase-like cupin family protein